jgi:hypothetical protein
MTPIARALDVPLVPWAQWLDALEAAAEKKDVSRIPALRLLGFFRTPRIGHEWEPVGVARLDTRLAQSAAPTLQRAKDLTKVQINQWLNWWQRVGLLRALKVSAT